jgi:YD repeat-containing protein
MHFVTIFVIAALISSGVYLGRWTFVKRAILTVLALIGCMAAITWGGPLSSGALFLLLPGPPQTTSGDLPPSYRPLHQGHVDLATGLYIREDEDIVLSDSPSFVWRRAYLSGYHFARQLGIGTTHNAERYLSGDPNTLQRIDLIREDGARIVFDRTSRGSSYLNAMFIHTTSATEFYGAELGWVGRRWAMRLDNGALAIFQDCSPDAGRACSIVSLRDPNGRVVLFNRDDQGILRTIDAGDQHLSFEYDDQDRILHAASGQHAASYSYDHLGRLVRATVDGTLRSYDYGARDEMTSIHDPERTIVNTYDGNLRLARQVVHRTGRPDYAEAFAYTVEDGKVLETTVSENDGSRTAYRWNEDRQQETEIHESDGGSPVMVQFARGGGTFTRSITVFCKKDRRPVSETADVAPGDEEAVKAELIGRICN